MSHLTTKLRALEVAAAAALTGGIACLGTATAAADPSDVLVASLSKGYSASNCTSQTANGVLALMQCGQNADTGGPVFGKYLLFANAADLASAFTSGITLDTLANCGEAHSPTTWHQGSTGNSAGQVACGTYQGQAEVIWTTTATNVLGLIRASNGDTAALYQWWHNNG